MKLKVTVNGIAYSVDVEVEEEQRQLGSIVFGGSPKNLEPSNAKVSGASLNAVVAPLAGSVFKVLVAEGDQIEEGQALLILEAMKMETEITAPNAGTVTHLHVAPGDPVQGGQALLEIE
ncbi:acetyl-CoA carboxylase biotin carboxyl carrier protein subunit [Corynebacterium hindlerae]|uniref:biotin carboxylase n=1 Tax=Corynebacterium hindlerae TaxID=699041 RepID=A0A7G5FGZ8_9CORY|nr:biotin/lipoyl-containing protein [Corynebacterium hindlerae]QMV85889.1 acetyl-CoA carboxylase biotin carboxyl carrier protein subunit [Corynebacterium hindlerae]